MSEVKIATCCYCGTRAALVLAGRARHELACRSCGAPLTALKRLRADRPAERAALRPGRGPLHARPPARPPRRRKGVLRRALEEAWDEIEDLFD